MTAQSELTELVLFSQFTDQEFDQLSALLCSVFVTTKAEIESLYAEIIADFDKEKWPPHFVGRSFFESVDADFRATYVRSPSIAVDLPSLFELDDGVKNKPTLVILGQDSKSDQSHEDISVGTPYGLHHKGSREELKRTKLYFDMIAVLLNLGCRVYLTDVYKVWVCDPNRPYYGIKLPEADRSKFVSVLAAELAIMNPSAIVTWGRDAASSLADMELGFQHLEFPHPSGAANGAWKKRMQKSPTYENKLQYWKETVSQSLSS
jgi:hypothetical protein